MKTEVSLEEVNEHLLGKQNLDFDGKQSAARLLTRLGGFYGAAPTCYLSLLSRVRDFRFAELDEELDARRVARLRCMRGSLFLTPTPSLPSVFNATKRQCVSAFARLLEASGVRRDAYERAASRVEETLRGRTLTATELKTELKGEDESVTRALNFVISLMCAEGRLVRARVRGGWKSNSWEYARLGEWLPEVELDTIAPREARASLSRLYFESFGPATAEDFRWWSGFNAEESAEALEAVGDELTHVSIDGLDGAYLISRSEASRLGSRPKVTGRPRVSLLPMWDAYTMAYKAKERYLDARVRAYVYDRAGNAAPAVLLEGRVGGVWEWTRKRREVVVRVALFGAADARVWAELKEAAGRFAHAAGGESATLLRCALPRVSASGINFRSPLGGVGGVAVK